jgi:hypothetical protein
MQKITNGLIFNQLGGYEVNQNINLNNYWGSITYPGSLKKNTLLRKWQSFNSKHIKYNGSFCEDAKYMSIIDRILRYICFIPHRIETWLCVGSGFWVYKYDNNNMEISFRILTFNDDYVLMTKLCRYKTWNNVKITTWDKIRFKLVTGCNFIEN